MKELISVIMCTYNETREELDQAISSILNQTYPYIELLIVLDNPDNTLIRDTVEEYAYADKRIRVICNECNIGVATSSNRALEQAEGNYIAKMDADDIAFPQRLELELKILKNQNLDFVSASKINIDENGREVGAFINDLSPDKLRRLLPHDNLVTQSTVLMRKQVAVELGGYMALPSCEDYDMWLRMLCMGYQMAVIPDILVYYRVRRNSITRTDYYKQYLSDRFVREMYRRNHKAGKIWSLEDYETYLKKINPTQPKKERFNHAYRSYYLAMEARKTGKYGSCFTGLLISAAKNPVILRVFLRKLVFHMRKRIVA